LLLVALLLVPLVASGHYHGTDRNPSCATCAVAHAPVSAGPTFVVPTPVQRILDVPVRLATVPTDPTPRRATGRAPPAILPTQGA
jgi:hypothetical protein